MYLIKSVSAFTRLSDQVTVQQFRGWAEDSTHVVRARFLHLFIPHFPILYFRLFNEACS